MYDDPVIWVCFCMLWQHRYPLTDLEIAVKSNIETRRVRASLNRLASEALIVRVGAQVHGQWTVSWHSTIDRLLTDLAQLRHGMTLAPADDDADAYYCASCEAVVDVLSIIDQLQSSDQPTCPTCRTVLCDGRQRGGDDDDDVGLLREQIDAWTADISQLKARIEAWTASDVAAHRAHLPPTLPR